MSNPITGQVTIQHLGIELFSQASHDNIFIVRKTGSGIHSNEGLFSIYYYSSDYGHSHMYHVPLMDIGRGEGEFNEYVTRKWAEYCELRGIRKNKNPKVHMTTKVNEARVGSMKGFFEFVKTNPL